MNLRENWRVIVLVLMLVGSGVILFTPGLVGGETTGPTNLQYGLELDGGTRLRAPVVGMTAEKVDVSTTGNPTALRDAVADNLSIPTRDVYVQPRSGTVEVFNDSISKEEFATVLNQQGVTTQEGSQVTTDDIRDGVTQATRQQVVDTINRKLSETGLSGGSATIATTVDGDKYIVVEAPNRDAEELKKLVNDRGIVEVHARYPGSNGTMEEQRLLTYEDLRRVGDPEVSQEGVHQVPVVLTQDAAKDFSNILQQTGFTSDGVSSCPRDVPEGEKNSEGYCLVTIVNGEVTATHSLGPSLANSMNQGTFVDDPRFVMTATNESEARDIAVNLRAGALRAPLDFDNAQVYSLEPALADRFKTNSLITGLIAVLAVSGVVYLRYGEPKIAVPMIVTALAEVVLLLGFVAAVRLPLDLSHIAGFIAVIGTGVDDLIIIADEVMSEGEVSSSRVFQSRFRKAFWVIGAAAATTIIAMSPLAVLSLGDLRGFAIVTILGVLIGVLITRPAYGDILRSLTTGEH
ncbi:preprotein translocase subunit SecD [Haloarchaeobius sp. TZWWS8]|uniref:preprotein translocase subunit SecD n=1 Tax=Haloarchaeobius sp. TZWWS8 TaxID=3446121 RepID=UPI003EBEED22